MRINGIRGGANSNLWLICLATVWWAVRFNQQVSSVPMKTAQFLLLLRRIHCEYQLARFSMPVVMVSIMPAIDRMKSISQPSKMQVHLGQVARVRMHRGLRQYYLSMCEIDGVWEAA